MNKFEKQLEKWNHGVLRGAQARLAKTLGVSTATAALWTTGKRRPSKGYIEQMAQLFNMDALDVYKLFSSPSVIYPDIHAPSHAPVRNLRDRHTEDCSYHALPLSRTDTEDSEPSNSVALPFLDQVPDASGHYEEDHILEWWSVPRRFAQGAKYLLRAAAAGLNQAGQEDLCFVRPGKDMPEGKLILFRSPAGEYLCRRVKYKNGKPVFFRPDSKKADAQMPGEAVGVLSHLLSRL